MAVQTITFNDKSNLNVNSQVPDINKINDNDMNEIKNVVNNNAFILEGIKGKLVWTNPNPSSSFGAQNVTLDANSSNMLLWIFKRQASADLIISVMSISGYGVFASAVNMTGDTVRRGITYSSGTTYAVGGGTLGSGSADDSLLVPIYVIALDNEITF